MGRLSGALDVTDTARNFKFMVMPIVLVGVDRVAPMLGDGKACWASQKRGGELEG